MGHMAKPGCMKCAGATNSGVRSRRSQTTRSSYKVIRPEDTPRLPRRQTLSALQHQQTPRHVMQRLQRIPVQGRYMESGSDARGEGAKVSNEGGGGCRRGKPAGGGRGARRGGEDRAQRVSATREHRHTPHHPSLQPAAAAFTAGARLRAPAVLRALAAALAKQRTAPRLSMQSVGPRALQPPPACPPPPSDPAPPAAVHAVD